MTHLRSILLALVAGLAPISLSAQPSPPPPDPADLLREVTRVGRSLERIEGKLDAFVALHRASLLLQRLAVEERRLDPLRDDLRRAREEARAFQDEVARLGTMKEDVEERQRHAVRNGLEAEAAELRETLKQIELALKTQVERQDAIDRRIRILESDLDRARRSSAALDEQLRQAVEELSGPSRPGG